MVDRLVSRLELVLWRYAFFYGTISFDQLCLPVTPRSPVSDNLAGHRNIWTSFSTNTRWAILSPVMKMSHETIAWKDPQNPENPITSHYIASHCITSHRTASHCIASHHITSHCTDLHHITSHHITSHHITSPFPANEMRSCFFEEVNTKFWWCTNPWGLLLILAKFCFCCSKWNESDIGDPHHWCSLYLLHLHCT